MAVDSSWVTIVRGFSALTASSLIENKECFICEFYDMNRHICVYIGVIYKLVCACMCVRMCAFIILIAFMGECICTG